MKMPANCHLLVASSVKGILLRVQRDRCCIGTNAGDDIAISHALRSYSLASSSRSGLR